MQQVIKCTKQINFKNPLVWLSASLFLTGGTGLISQYILATISSYLTGNTVEQFSITVAVMMGMMGVGSLWQKKIEDVSLAKTFIVVEISLSLLIGFSPLFVYWSFTTDFYGVAYFLMVALTGFLIGLEIPLIIRINKKYMLEIKNNVGWVFSLDYFGAMIGGGIIWTFIVLPYVNIMQAGFIAGGMNLVVAVITWYAIKGKNKGIVLLFVSVLGLMVIGYHFAPKWESVLEQKMYDDKVVSVANTPYQHIVMTKRKDDLRMFINGNIQFSSKDEKRYHDFLVHPVMNMVSHPQSILIFGGGDGLAVREIKKYVEKGLTKDVVLVDIDRKMIEYASTNAELVLLNHGAFLDFDLLDKYFEDYELKGKKIVIDDATAFVNKLNRRGSKNFDIVVMDLPDPSNLSVGKMYSLDFFKGLKNIMNEHSAMVIQSSSPFFAKKVFLTIGKTLKASGFNKVIPYRFNIPSFGEWGWWIACKGKCEIPEKFSVKTEFVTPELFMASAVWGENELKGEAKVNKIAQPVIVQMYKKSVWE